MPDEWIIRVEGKEYGPADLATLREWKADGRVLPSNPARSSDSDVWKTAGEIPGLFRMQPPPIQTAVESHISEVPEQRSETSRPPTPTKPPTRNFLTETFRIYFRGFFQFLGLTILTLLPSISGQFTAAMIEGTSTVNVDLRTLVAGAFSMSMFVLTLILWPVYLATIQVLSAELATGGRPGFFSALNHAVKYWPRVAGLCIFVYGVFFLLFVFGTAIGVMVAVSTNLFSIVIALGLLTLQVWLFGRFFVNVLFWQQFAVLENLPALDALRESKNLARSGRELSWYQRPLWRGALIVSIWSVFVLAITIGPQWTVARNYFIELMRTQDPQAVLQKMTAALQSTHGIDRTTLELSLLQRLFQPLLGIAFVVLYLDSKGER